MQQFQVVSETPVHSRYLTVFDRKVKFRASENPSEVGLLLNVSGVWPCAPAVGGLHVSPVGSALLTQAEVFRTKQINCHSWLPDDLWFFGCGSIPEPKHGVCNSSLQMNILDLLQQLWWPTRQPDPAHVADLDTAESLLNGWCPDYIW